MSTMCKAPFQGLEILMNEQTQFLARKRYGLWGDRHQ